MYDLPAPLELADYARRLSLTLIGLAYTASLVWAFSGPFGVDLDWMTAGTAWGLMSPVCECAFRATRSFRRLPMLRSGVAWYPYVPFANDHPGGWRHSLLAACARLLFVVAFLAFFWPFVLPVNIADEYFGE